MIHDLRYPLTSDDSRCLGPSRYVSFKTPSVFCDEKLKKKKKKSPPLSRQIEVKHPPRVARIIRFLLIIIIFIFFNHNNS